MGARYDEMIQATAREDATPGALLLVGVRSLVIRMAVVAALATVFCINTNSMGGMTNGATNPVYENSSRVMALSPLVYVAMVAVVVWAIGRAVRGAYSEAQTLLLFDRAVRYTAIALAALVVLSQVLFMTGANAFFATNGDVTQHGTSQFLLGVGQVTVSRVLMGNFDLGG